MSERHVVIGKLKLYVLAAVLALLGAFGLIRKGRTIERANNELKRLKDDKAMRKRIDDAKPADNPDDARVNLIDWMRKRK